jgi:GntR family transcriptional regulator
MLHEKGIPLYYQLESILRQRILSGGLPFGGPLPSEEALGHEYNVSRITVRQALASLEKDGLIFRKRGKGTFVKKRVPPLKSPRFTGFMEDLISMGINTEAKILNMGMIDAPPRVRELLKLDEEDTVLRVEKVRLVEGRPFSYVLNYLPREIGKGISRKKLSVKPMLMILEDELGMKAIEATQTVESTVADPQVAPLLNVRVGDPLLKVERTVFDAKKRPIEYVWVLYRADKYFFTVNLKRKKSEKSVGWKTI